MKPQRIPGLRTTLLLAKEGMLHVPNIETARVLEREGILRAKPPKATLSDLHSASIYLFRFILHEKDPRWGLVFEYLKLPRFKPINFENALRAKYASQMKSKRNQYSSAASDINLRQIARAISNIKIGTSMLEKKFGKPISLGKNCQAIFERTRSISERTDERGVTGCPEALWQLQLYSNKKYLGRIGFNFHFEHENPILSIVNIQGAKGREKELATAKQELGKPFGEALVSFLKSELGRRVRCRGIVNTEKNPALYTMTFRRTKIRTF